MSTRIITPGRTVLDSPLTSEDSFQSPESKPVIRLKRPRTIESEDEDDEVERDDRARRHSSITSSAAGQSSTRFERNSRGHDTVIDVVGHSGDEHFQQDASQNSKKPRQGLKPKSLPKVDGPPKKKKAKQSVTSDAEFTEEEYHELEIQHYASEDISDASDEFSKHKGKGKGVTRRNSKGVKRKSKPIEVNAKDESRPLPAKGPRAKPMLQLEETELDVVGDLPPASESVTSLSGVSLQVEHDEATPPPAKKRKLPTIKKNKLVPSSGPSTPSSATIASILGPTPASARPGVSDTKGSTPGTRLPAAQVGVADVDLMNRNIYDQLFKGTGGSTPASNRRAKEEERRRELDKMRDEAKAKRELEAAQSFDLQAQYEKISRFEERLKFVRSNALFPNFLAAKWREIWERNKYREQALQEPRDSNGDEQEEGETT